VRRARTAFWGRKLVDFFAACEHWLGDSQHKQTCHKNNKFFSNKYFIVLQELH